MKTLRKYYAFFILFAYIAFFAVYAYIPYTYARPASWINPRFLDSEIPEKSDPWLDKQKELIKEQEELKKSGRKNI